MRELILYVALPYAAIVALLVVPVLRGIGSPIGLAPLPRRPGRPFWGTWVWAAGLGLLLAGHLVAFVFPGAIAIWHASRYGTLAIEALGLVFSELVLVGLAASAFARRRMRRQATSAEGSVSPIPLSSADAFFLLVVLLAVAAGLASSLGFRWGSVWYADTLLPYVRSLARFEPEAGLLAELPFVVRLHTVAGFVALGLLPFTRFGLLLARPWRRLRRSGTARREATGRRFGPATKAALAGLALGLGALALLGGQALHSVGSSQGYAPVQPIAFSHRLHAGDRQIPCLYCHFVAERSRHAGIPAANVCMNCHGRLRLASAELQKLKEAVAQNRAIRWVKIHNLPDFVYFDHSQHVAVARLACQRCHGPIETMDRVRQVAPLTMGWCLDCHRSEGVVLPALRTAALPPDLARTRATGGQDCSKCHY